MDTDFWFYLGCVYGSLSRKDLQEDLEEQGYSKEEQDALRKQIHNLVKIAYKER